ncbi:MAG: NAD(P)H-dependent glycerol-3-phosphate dehydrogenase, partial [Robiginitomaculum sp.]|nr:NAD(P)H-dependent glycerol-3-phosphate dehydrogenase [Robiginitomaculum sp.]
TFLVMALTFSAKAQVIEDKVSELEGVDIVEHLGEYIPLDLVFTNDEGEEVTLATYFDGEQPVLLMLGYYECPMLCNLVFDGIVNSVKNVKLLPGKDYKMVSVSINHREGFELAAAKKANYMTALDIPSAQDGWTFLTGDSAMSQNLANAIAAPTFRPYLSTDVLGAEIGGAVKNVLAIACGMVLGKGLGRSAHAALITRGFAEMTRLGAALGARPETLTGMCGLGDLVLTCSSEQSRNMSAGMALGKGQSLGEIMSARTAVTEGVATAPALKHLAAKAGVEMPICEAVANILDGSAELDAAIKALLSRAYKLEV